jgi:hypothetical protein
MLSANGDGRRHPLWVMPRTGPGAAGLAARPHSVGLARKPAHHAVELVTCRGNIRANLRQTEFVGADLTRTNLNGSELYNANFTFATLKETLLSGANLGWAIFSGAKLGGLSLRDVDLTDVQAGPEALGDIPIPDGWERDPGTWPLKRRP